MLKLKAYLGPVGDDLPSIIAIVLSLVLFFSAVAYSFNVYSQKQEALRMLKAGIDIGRILMSEGITGDLNSVKKKADPIAKSYGVSYDVSFNECSNDYVLKLKYLVVKNNQPAVAYVCVK